MIPTIEDLQGTWVSRDFPMYNYEDGREFIFHFGRYATPFPDVRQLSHQRKKRYRAATSTGF